MLWIMGQEKIVQLVHSANVEIMGVAGQEGQQICDVIIKHQGRWMNTIVISIMYSVKKVDDR